MSGSSEPSVSAMNFSKASPGPSLVHFNCSSFETLSKDRPMLSSRVVANNRNDTSEMARRRRVCPPDIRTVRKGNLGSLGYAVRRGVKAWPC